MISKQEQQVKDILTDFACDTCQDCERDIADDNIVAIVVKKIMDVFRPSQKDTKSRRERKLDEQFAAMGIKLRVYHFTKDIKPFKAVTIATEKHTWGFINNLLICVQNTHRYPSYQRPATTLRYRLLREGVYGIAICYKSDQFSKRTGRMKAKGRLMQHLLWVEKK